MERIILDYSQCDNVNVTKIMYANSRARRKDTFRIHAKKKPLNRERRNEEKLEEMAVLSAIIQC